MENLVIAVYVAGMVMLVEAIVKVVRIGKLQGWVADDAREVLARLLFVLLALFIVIVCLNVGWPLRALVLTVMAGFIGAIIYSFFRRRITGC